MELFDKLDTFNENMEIISQLGDNPNIDDGLSSEGLKGKFDEGNVKTKTFLNKLIGKLNTMVDKLNKLTNGVGTFLNGGTLLGALNVNKQRVYGLQNPTQKDEAVPKEYADQQILDRVIYSGGKNLLRNDAMSRTTNGITFTVNADGSVTINGTATADADLYIRNYWGVDDPFLPAGKYILSGNHDLRVDAYVGVGGSHIAYARDEDVFFSAPNGIAWYTLRAHNGYQFDNLTVYPMIRLASETDATYEPYYEGLQALTNRGMELLWENASPASAFAAQTISLNLTGFWGCIIIMAEASAVIKKNGSAQLRNVNRWGLGVNEFQDKIRACSVNENSVWFSDSFYITNAASEVRNTDLIPIQIYGIKGGIA